MPSVDINRIRVTPEDAERFHTQWTVEGVVVLMDKVHFQFAADFATLAIKAFAQQFLAQEAKPKIVLADK